MTTLLKLFGLGCFVLASACGGSAPPPAPVASPPPSAAPSAPAAVGDGPVMPPAVDQALSRVMAAYADPTDKNIQAAYAPDFIKAKPLDELRGFLSKLKSTSGACKEHQVVEVYSPEAASVLVHCESASWLVAIFVDSSRLVNMIRWSPSMSPALETATRRVRALLSRPTEDAVRAIFTQRFIGGLGMENIVKVFQQQHEQHGDCRDHRNLAFQQNRAVVRMECKRSAIHLTIELDSSPLGQIDYLKIDPATED